MKHTSRMLIVPGEDSWVRKGVKGERGEGLR